MPRIPKHDAPTLAYFFLLLLIVGVTVAGAGIGIIALGGELKPLAVRVVEFFNEMLWVLR